jgi:O-antigen ligase
MGVGLGAYGAVVPQIKAFDAASETASSALLQWWAEAGLAGALILAVAFGWAGWALRGAWLRVGQADRALPAGMVGALAAFAAFSTLHWSVQGIAVALAAAAVVGTANRWLAGGTDLFVDSA